MAHGAASLTRRSPILGEPVSVAGPQQAIALGLGLMAQDRRDCLIQDQSILDNMMMATIAKGAGLAESGYRSNGGASP